MLRDAAQAPLRAHKSRKVVMPHAKILCRLHQHVDFVVCLGGDGTILHASSLFQRAIPPVISFSAGSLGFLTNHSLEHAEADLRAVIYGCAGLDQCSLEEEVRLVTARAHLPACRDVCPFFAVTLAPDMRADRLRHDREGRDAADIIGLRGILALTVQGLRPERGVAM